MHSLEPSIVSDLSRNQREWNAVVDDRTEHAHEDECVVVDDRVHVHEDELVSGWILTSCQPHEVTSGGK